MDTQRTTRQVIQNKLLEALTDEGVVALLFSEQDCDDLLSCLDHYSMTISAENSRRYMNLRGIYEGVKRLKEGAFGS